MRLPHPVQLAQLSLTRPKLAASLVLAVGLSAGQAAVLSLLAIIIGTILAAVGAALRPISDTAMSLSLLNQPLLAVAVQFSLMLAFCLLIAWVGRAFGGRGDFRGAISCFAWLQILLTALQALQLVILILLPFLAGLVGLASFFWFIWALSNFAAVLHGFDSAVKTGGLIFISLFSVLFIASILLTSLGVSLPELN